MDFNVYICSSLVATKNVYYVFNNKKKFTKNKKLKREREQRDVG